MTPAGIQALKIARWAWEDPASRVASALYRVREMARNADGQELREIQDAGTMLDRLAGTLDTEPVVGEDTILAQLAGDTITSQLIELAHTGWEHELRDRSGKWSKTGGAAAAATRSAKGNARLKRMQEAQARFREQQGGGGNKAAAVVKAAGGTPAARTPSSVEQAEMAFFKSGQVVQTPREKALHDHLMSKAQAVALEATKKVKAEEDTQHAKRAKLRYINETALAATGGALSYLAIKSGAPEIVPILASVGPYLLALLIELWKKW